MTNPMHPVGELVANTKVQIHDELHRLTIWNGPNGSGKTARFEAIELALTGKRKSGRVDDLRIENVSNVRAFVKFTAPRTMDARVETLAGIGPTTVTGAYDSALGDDAHTVEGPAPIIVRPALWLTTLGPSRAREEVVARWGTPTTGEKVENILEAPATLSSVQTACWNRGLAAVREAIAKHNEKHANDPLPTDMATILAELQSWARKEKLAIGRSRTGMETSIETARASLPSTVGAEDIARLETMLAEAETAEKHGDLAKRATEAVNARTTLYNEHVNRYVSTLANYDAMPPADPEKLAKALADAETSAANLVAHQNAIAIVPTLRSLIQSNTQHCPVCSQTYDGTGLLKQVEAQVSAVEAKIVEFKTAYETNRDLAASLSHTENVRKNTKAWLTSEHARLAEEAAAIEAATKTIPPPYTGPASGTIRLNLLSARAAEASRKALAAQIEQVEKYNAEWKIAQTVEFAAGEVLETVTSRISESLTSAVKSFLPEGLRERFVFSIDGCRFLMIGNDGRPHGRHELCGAEYAALTLALAQAWAAGSPYILLLDYRNDLADFDAYGVLAAVLQTIATTATADPNCLMVGITSPVGLPVTEFWHVINTGVPTPVTIDPSPVGSVAAPASVPGTRSLLERVLADADDGEEAPEEPAKPKRGRPPKATKLAAAGRKGGPKK